MSEREFADGYALSLRDIDELRAKIERLKDQLAEQAALAALAMQDNRQLRA